jgi:hypothetical protein
MSSCGPLPTIALIEPLSAYGGKTVRGERARDIDF